jgi:hypothetical protein
MGVQAVSGTEEGDCKSTLPDGILSFGVTM